MQLSFFMLMLMIDMLIIATPLLRTMLRCLRYAMPPLLIAFAPLLLLRAFFFSPLFHAAIYYGAFYDAAAYACCHITLFITLLRFHTCY